MIDLDKLVNDGRFKPYYGWHDDHRHVCETAAYMPAIQQNRAEFVELVNLLARYKLKENCLQIGLGIPGGSHFIFRNIFERVFTIENNSSVANHYMVKLGDNGIIIGDSHYELTKKVVPNLQYDFLFIDGDHSMLGTLQDYDTYKSLVKEGGMIAFHDALFRKGYDELGTPMAMQSLRNRGIRLHMIGEEIGIAWLIKGVDDVDAG